MQIPTLSPSFSLASVRRELRYTLVRMRPLPWAAAQVPVFEGLLKHCDSLMAQETKLQDALEDAEAQLDHVDGELDALVLHLDKLIRAELNGASRDALLRAMFQGQPPSRFVRPMLGPELEAVRGWPALLSGSSLAKLVALAAEVETLLKRIDTAVSTQAKAASDLAAFALNTQGPFVAKVNAERQSLGGESRKQNRLDGLDREFGLFRRVSKSRATPATLSSVQELIREAETELAALNAQKAELEQEAKASAEAQAERQRNQAALADLEKLEAETQEKAKALRTKLGLP